MKDSDLKLRLLNRLRAAGKPAIAAGIDLGTTKSCIAYARFDAAANTLDCYCLPFYRPDGTRSVSFPSAVAQQADQRLFGAEALAPRKTPGIHEQRDLFLETKNLRCVWRGILWTRRRSVAQHGPLQRVTFKQGCHGATSRSS